MRCLKITAVLLTLILLSACGKPAIPYTEAGLDKLNLAIEKIGMPFGDTSRLPDDQKCKAYYKYLDQLFKEAGYDLDKSIIQFTNDLEKGDLALSGYNLYRQDRPNSFLLVTIEKLGELHCQKNLKPKVVEAIKRTNKFLDSQKASKPREEEPPAPLPDSDSSVVPVPEVNH